MVLNKLEDQRRTLRARIRAYQTHLIKVVAGQLSCATVIGASLDELSSELEDEDNLIVEALNEYPERDEDSGDEEEEDLDEPLDLCFIDDEDTLLTRPESIAIWMPSRYASSSPPQLCTQEQMLRESQANEALQGIRYGIGHKSVLIKFLVRRNRDAGQHKRTRAWDEVNSSHSDLIKSWASYRRAREALSKLPGAKDLLKKFLPIEKGDLNELKDITEENRVGQRNDTLPWFWRMGGSNDGPEWSVESMCCVPSYV